VTVAQDAVLAAADPRGSSFGSALTREQIDSLSDDPAILAQQLQDIAGSTATIRVDSFEGGDLPNKAQIKSIHVTRDTFAAENHSAGSIFVDIITQPGIGALRGGFNTRLLDSHLSGINQFTGVKNPERSANYQLNVGGSLIHQRASFSLNLNGTNQYTKPVTNTTTSAGTIAQVLGTKTTFDRLGIQALFDYALTKDQTLRLAYSQNGSTNNNLGIGEFDLPERASFNENHSYQFRMQEAGPLGRRFFINTRLNVTFSDSDSHALTEARTINVAESFIAGGAQVSGGRHGKSFTAISDLDYVRGIHSVRMGTQIDGGWYRSDSSSNYLGTYYFASYDDYVAGKPQTYTQRVGNPVVEYFAAQGGVYIQDDIRVRRNLTLSPGVRYELEAHMDDFNAVGPRFGVTWAPFKSGRTTLRASAGIFFDWLIPDTYEQTIRNDGLHQLQLNIANPTYPDPGIAGTVQVSDKYLLQPGLHFMHNRRLSAGIDQTINPKFRVSATYQYINGDGQWRGKNLNAPVDGVRPDPNFANIIQATNDAAQVQHQVSTSFQLNLASQGPPPRGDGPGAVNTSGPRWDWHRLGINGTYTLGSFRNNTDNRFAVPASGTPSTEWGPAPGDVRHRFNVGVSSAQLRNLNVNLNLNMSSGSPYTIRTGTDDNLDGIQNDRPIGVGRNTARTDGPMNLNGFFTYTFVFGHSTVAAPPGVGVSLGPGQTAPTITTFNAAPPRYRLQLQVQVLNMTNHANYSQYDSIITSATFGQPRRVNNPRTIEVGLSLNF